MSLREIAFDICAVLGLLAFVKTVLLGRSVNRLRRRVNLNLNQ